MKTKVYLLVVILLSTFLNTLLAQDLYKSHWEIEGKSTIQWDLNQDYNLPHSDNIEMAGSRVAGIVTYSIDSLRNLSLQRQVFFPQLHPLIKETDPAWFIYRAYLKNTFDDSITPKLFIRNHQFVPGKVATVQINGTLVFTHEASSSGLVLVRKLYPSMDERLFIEEWNITNSADTSVAIEIGNTELNYEDKGASNRFYYRSITDFPSNITLAPGTSFKGAIKIMARTEDELYPTSALETISDSRMDFLEQLQGSLNLETPEPVLNTLFEFSKVRASESIFESKLGLIHSPGGGRYYVGIWANDQAEYISPFFPYLGYEKGNLSADNTYQAFTTKINPEYTPIPYAFEVETYEPPSPLDRGDAAMIAYGASQYALASGNRQTAKKIWPLIEWLLTYCHKQLNKEGVVRSQSDEMEGRIATGTANLSTASLYYGALNLSAALAEALGKTKNSKLYSKRARKLGMAIENYFGTNIDGLNTYKYYKEHQDLRHWICLPLVVGIHNRKEDTIKALFDHLWTTNGVHVEKNNVNPAIANIFWDRGTLYALRGTFLAGATDVSLEKLLAFSKERLLGSRVPYVVEAFPEGNMAHLSAESGLYCRVFTEGMFGIIPTGFSSFTLQPRLPEHWNKMALRNVKAFNQNFDIEVKRKGNKTLVQITDVVTEQLLLRKYLEKDEPLHFRF